MLPFFEAQARHRCTFACSSCTSGPFWHQSGYVSRVPHTIHAIARASGPNLHHHFLAGTGSPHFGLKRNSSFTNRKGRGAPCDFWGNAWRETMYSPPPPRPPLSLGGGAAPAYGGGTQHAPG